MTATAPARAKLLANVPTLRQFTRVEYRRMAKAGILKQDERIELLDGAIVQMAPITSRYAACHSRLNTFFIIGCGERARVFSH